MSRRKKVGDALVPWAGLVVGLLALAIVHQFGSEGMFNHCATVSPGPLLIVALLGLSACALGGLVSWRGARSDGGARRVIGIVSTGTAALFAFAILLPMIAALVLPPCFE